MLSMMELQNKKVEAKRKKYEKDEMDAYLDLVFDNYKNLLEANKKLEAEKAEMNKKIKTLSDGVQYYRSIETTLQKALILAEKTSKETKDAAILKAETIEKEAHKRADDIVHTAEEKYDKIKNKCIRLIQEFNQYKLQLKEAASAQLQLVDGEQFNISKPEELDKPLDAVIKEEIPKAKPAAEPKPPRPQPKPRPAAKPQNPLDFDSSREELLNADTIDLRTTVNTVQTEVEPEISITPQPAKTPEPAAPVTSTVKPAAPVASAPKPAAPVASTPKPAAPVTNTIELTSPVANTVEPATIQDPAAQAVISDQIEKPDSLTAPAKEAPVLDKIGEPAVVDKVGEPAALDKIEAPKPAKNPTVLEPVEAKVVEPMDIIFEDEIAANEELQNEKIEPEPKSAESVPTLDSLLQDLNINNQNNKKSDDPFEFLGSVDDF
ncbi:MAG: DivIVA domain-containing protein [Roseburia sp.]|nr:DivIVA domain-containing protein [Roseburia sp.]